MTVRNLVVTESKKNTKVISTHDRSKVLNHKFTIHHFSHVQQRKQGVYCSQKEP